VKRASDTKVLQQPVGELGHGEDLDEVEEQLQGLGRQLSPIARSRQTSKIRDVHHPPSVPIAAAPGS
jgi:hypothetical protein